MNLHVGEAHEIHIWKVSVDQNLRHPLDLLSPDERERAARFHFATDRNRFVRRRSALRRILAHYSRTSPESLRIAYGPHGKPALVQPDAEASIQFSVSHSSDLAIVAVTHIAVVGVDLERVQHVPRALQLAHDFFSESEIGELGRLPTAELDSGFLRCWTRKEALLKATGEGLSLRLDAYSVPVGEAPALDTYFSSQSAVQGFRLHDVPLGTHYISALAVAGAGTARLEILDADVDLGRIN